MRCKSTNWAKSPLGDLGVKDLSEQTQICDLK